MFPNTKHKANSAAVFFCNNIYWPYLKKKKEYLTSPPATTTKDLYSNTKKKEN